MQIKVSTPYGELKPGISYSVVGEGRDYVELSNGYFLPSYLAVEHVETVQRRDELRDYDEFI